MSAIFHYGSCIEKDHYTSICKEGLTFGLRNDAQIRKRQPRSATDICIIFLQKIDK